MVPEPGQRRLPYARRHGSCPWRPGIGIVGFAVTPFVVILAAIGAAASAIYGRRRLAIAFFAIAALAVIAPIVAALMAGGGLY